MGDNTKEALIIGAIAIAVVGLAIAFGSQTSNGVSFASADPQAVSAVESSAASEAESASQSANENIQSVLGFALGLADLQTQTNNAQIDLAATENTNAAQTQQVGLQTSAAVQETANNDATNVQTTSANDAATEAVANSVAAANEKIASYGAQAQEAAASAAQNASNTKSNDSLWGSLASAVGSLFSWL